MSTESTPPTPDPPQPQPQPQPQPGEPSQPDQVPHQPHAVQYAPRYYEPPPTNSLGIAGFVVSLSGLVACLGLISPIGLIISLIAMTKSPRGYAVAGSLLGLLGSVMGTAAILLFTGVIGSGWNFGNSYYYGGVSPTQYELDNASWDINQHFMNNVDTLPDQATGDALIASYTDEWGNALVYTPVPGSTNSYTLKSPGPDGVANTYDDIDQVYTAMTRTESAMEDAEWEIDNYHSTYGRLPDAPTGTAAVSGYRDSWNNNLRYAPDPLSTAQYTLASPGEDGSFDTDDDVVRSLTVYGATTLPLVVPDEDVQAERFERLLDAAAERIGQSFPPGAPLPGEAEVADRVGPMLDVWNNPMRYSPTSNPPFYHLKSAGPDGQWDTNDDITRSFYFSPTGQADGPT